jgi:hypothetical protein
MAAAILITGANRGLGFEYASQYLAEGWCLFAACRGLWFPTVICSARTSISIDPHRYRDINQIIDVWLPLTLATNCTNRSMGRPDLYSSCYRRALSTNLAISAI